MKKLISLILILCMTCMLIPAMADEDIAGEWFMKTMKQEGQEIDVAAMGMTIKMTLNADGTGLMEMPGQDPAEVTWVLDGSTITVTSEGSPISGTVADGTITLGNEAMEMLFSKEQGETLKMADVNPAAAAEDFEGEWEIAYVGMGGMVVDPSITGESMPNATIENGALKFIGQSSMTAMFGEQAIQLTYADGAMSYDLTFGESSVTIKAELLQDGMLSLTMGIGETLVAMYFVRVGAAEEAPAA